MEGILSTRGILETPGDRFFPKEFAAFGPFCCVRTPMSLGALILMLGLGLYDHVIIVKVEEPGLEKRFGESYRQYKPVG